MHLWNCYEYLIQVSAGVASLFSLLTLTSCLTFPLITSSPSNSTGPRPVVSYESMSINSRYFACHCQHVGTWPTSCTRRRSIFFSGEVFGELVYFLVTSLPDSCALSRCCVNDLVLCRSCVEITFMACLRLLTGCRTDKVYSNCPLP